MNKILLLFTLLGFTIFSCFDEDDYQPSSLGEIFTLEILDTNVIADGISVLTIHAVFDKDFNVENDEMIEFETNDPNVKMEKTELRKTLYKGDDKKIATYKITSNVSKTFKIKATARTKYGVEIVKEIAYSFKSSFPISNLFTLEVSDSNVFADGISVLEVNAIFDEEFNDEDDDMIEFENIQANSKPAKIPLRKILYKNEYKKIATFKISTMESKTITFKAIARTKNKVEISKEISYTFKPSTPERISVMPSSYLIKSDSSFSSIDIHTFLEKDNGKVSLGTICSTFVVDTMGAKQGLLLEYNNKTDSLGMIANKFSMGYSNYIGKLIIITSYNDKIIDTSFIYSQKK